MPSRLRKTRRLRGSRTMGWGQVGQHRKSGGRGGVGMAGLHKHKWSWTVKYAPDHFGRDKFKPPRREIVRRWINVGQIDEIARKILVRVRGKKKETRPTLDLSQLGYDKLLGGGKIQKPYKIKVKLFTESAKAKVEKAGGEIVTG